MTNHNESWAGNLVAWVIAVGGSWDMFGMSLPTVLVTVLTAWWTYEKAMAERARRQVYVSMAESQRPIRKSLLRRVMSGRDSALTDSGDLDSRSQQDPHAGK